MRIKKFIRTILRQLGYDVYRYHKQSQWKPPQVLSGLKLPLPIMSVCKLLPDRDHVLPLLSQGGIAAEVGVAYGDFSRKIIDIVKPEKFYAIDLFPNGPGIEFGRTDLSDSNLKHREFIEHKFLSEIGKGAFFIKQGLSWKVLETFDDNYFDYVYLDAGHDYDSVKKDIAILYNKIKNGGILQFNDYTHFDWMTGVPYGVIRAVDEFLLCGKHQILYYCFQPDGFDDIVVRINK